MITRWVRDDPQLPVELGSAPGEHPRVVSGICLGHVPFESPCLGFGDLFDTYLLADQLEQHPDFEVVVPGLQGSHIGSLAHPIAVLVHSGHHDGAAVGPREAAVAPHDLEAGRQALDVPLPRAGQGLVKVVDVKDHLPLGRAEQTEVRQVRVTAQLHRHPRHGRAGQVRGHDQRSARGRRQTAKPASARSGSGPASAPSWPPAPPAGSPGLADPAPAPSGHGPIVARQCGLLDLEPPADPTTGAPAATLTRTAGPVSQPSQPGWCPPAELDLKSSRPALTCAFGDVPPALKFAGALVQIIRSEVKRLWQMTPGDIPGLDYGGAIHYFNVQ